MTYGLIVVCLFVCVLIMWMVLVTMSDCLSMLFLVVTNFGHISISVLSTLSIKGRVILSDSEIIPIKLILTEALTATKHSHNIRHTWLVFSHYNNYDDSTAESMELCLDWDEIVSVEMQSIWMQ